MGEFTFNISQDFIRKLGKMADVDKFASKMIDEALPILDRHIKAGLQSHKGTGELLDSITIHHAKPMKMGGWYGYVTAKGVAKGKRYLRPKGGGRFKSEGYRNYQKILALEYGTSKQKPTPFLTKAVKDSEAAVLSKMQEVFNREVGV